MRGNGVKEGVKRKKKRKNLKGGVSGTGQLEKKASIQGKKTQPQAKKKS